MFTLWTGRLASFHINKPKLVLYFHVCYMFGGFFDQSAWEPYHGFQLLIGRLASSHILLFILPRHRICQMGSENFRINYFFKNCLEVIFFEKLDKFSWKIGKFFGKTKTISKETFSSKNHHFWKLFSSRKVMENRKKNWKISGKVGENS